MCLSPFTNLYDYASLYDTSCYSIRHSPRLSLQDIMEQIPDSDTPLMFSMQPKCP